MIGLRNSLRPVVFVTALLLGAVLLTGLLRGWYGHGVSEATAGVDTPARIAARGEKVALSIKARQQPVELRPIAGLADAVTEEQLIKALGAALPLWHPPTVPSLIHELKLWGRNADFTKEMVGQARSGTMMVETLLSDKLCQERTTPNGASFLLESPFGINVVLAGTMDAKENRAEGHPGQLLSVLGEVGVSLDTPVTTVSGRSGTVAGILQDATMRFAWTREAEFIGAALARWIPPETTWTDQFGNRYSFDDMAQHLMATPHGKGCCGGCHVPYTLVTILGVDRQYPLLSSPIRDRAMRWLADLSAQLEQTQLSDGAWDRTWPGKDKAGLIFEDPILDRVTVTGHHLEWIALAPESVRPSRAVVERAVSACVADIGQLPPVEKRSFKALLPCSHAARALCLMRDQDPFTAWMAYWNAKQSNGG